jgi:hypothetical protein
MGGMNNSDFTQGYDRNGSLCMALLYHHHFASGRATTYTCITVQRINADDDHYTDDDYRYNPASHT